MHNYSQRFRLFLERLEEQGLDGFLISHPANLVYLFNFSGSAGLACTIGTETRLLVDSRYFEEASTQAVNCRPELCSQPLLDSLKQHLSDRPRDRVGFESDSLTQRDFAILQSFPNGPRWYPQTYLIQELRSRKETSEIQLMKHNFRLAQIALQASFQERSPDWREIDFAGALELRMRRVGAEGFAFETIVASGTRSSLPHGLASDKRIGDDPLLVDFGLRRSGYCTDLTRMSAHQPEVLEIMKVVRDARQAAFQCIRPGIASTDIDGAARQAIVRAGYGEFFGHSLGHGLGLEVHELPRIGPTRGTPLEAGMVFTLEPGIYLPGRFGVRIEDVVVVEEAGARWLSDPEK